MKKRQAHTGHTATVLELVCLRQASPQEPEDPAGYSWYPNSADILQQLWQLASPVAVCWLADCSLALIAMVSAGVLCLSLSEARSFS